MWQVTKRDRTSPRSRPRKDATGFTGWPQTGGRTETDLVAAIATALKVPNTYDTKSQSANG
jgi:hypothetical protein